MVTGAHIGSAECQYVIKKTDPAFGLLKSVAVGFDNPSAGTRVACPDPLLNTLAIEMTISGTAALYYDDRRVKHSPGSLMLMLPDLKFYEIAGEEWRSCWFVLWGPLADTFCSDVDMRSLATAIKGLHGSMQLSMLEACRLILEQPVGWQWPWLNHLMAVLDYVRGRVAKGDEQEGSLVSRARHVMETTLTSPLPLPAIAECLHASLSTLAHQFRKETGVAPGLAYRQMRIDRAKQLLANGLNVRETSEQMGFENPYHFSRLFKRTEGMCPSEFRERTAQLALKRS